MEAAPEIEAQIELIIIYHRKLLCILNILETIETHQQLMEIFNIVQTILIFRKQYSKQVIVNMVEEQANGQMKKWRDSLLLIL